MRLYYIYKRTQNLYLRMYSIHIKYAHTFKKLEVKFLLFFHKVIHEKVPDSYVKIKVKNNRVAGCFKGGIKHKCLPSLIHILAIPFPLLSINVNECYLS